MALNAEENYQNLIFFLRRVKGLGSTFRTWMLVAGGNLPHVITLLIGRSLRAVTSYLANIE